MVPDWSGSKRWLWITFRIIFQQVRFHELLKLKLLTENMPHATSYRQKAPPVVVVTTQIQNFFQEPTSALKAFSAETMFSIHSDWLWKELKGKKKKKNCVVLCGSPKGSEACLPSSPAPIKQASSCSWQERQKVPPTTLQFASKWFLLARLQLDVWNRINRFQKCSICRAGCVILKKCVHKFRGSLSWKPA